MKRTELKRKSPLRRSSKTTKRKTPKQTGYTKKLRDYIKERDAYTCQICGGPGTQVHHVIPKGRFYKAWYTIESVHDPRNLCLVCHRCHRHDDPEFVEMVIEIQEKRFGALRKSMDNSSVS